MHNPSVVQKWLEHKDYSPPKMSLILSGLRAWLTWLYFRMECLIIKLYIAITHCHVEAAGAKAVSSPPPPATTLYVLAFEAKDIVWTIYLFFFLTTRSTSSMVPTFEGYIVNFLSKVPVRRFLRPSRSIHFGDVSETNGRETVPLLRSDHMTRNALAA